MLDKKALQIELIKKDMTFAKLAKSLGINPGVLYRKLRGDTDFYRREIHQIKTVLELDDETTYRIFFAE